MLLLLKAQPAYWDRFLKAPKGHPALLDAVLGLRFLSVFGLVLRFGLNRADYATVPEQLNWVRLVLVAYFFYLAVLAAVRWLAPRVYFARGSKLAQAGLDLVVMGFLYTLTRDLQSDLFVLFYLPLLVMAEYFGLFANLATLLVTALGFGLVLTVQTRLFDLEAANWELKVWLPRVFFFASLHLAYLVHRRLQTPSEPEVDYERAALLRTVDEVADAKAARRIRQRVASYTQKVERNAELLAVELEQKHQLVNQQMTAIFDASQAALASDVDEVIGRIMHVMGQALGCQAGALRLLGQNELNRQASLVLRAAFGYYLNQYSREARYLDLTEASLVVEAFVSNKVRLSGDVQAANAAQAGERLHFMDFARSYNLHTLICVPVRQGQRALGTLSFYREALRPFMPDEVDFLQALANYLALNLTNAELFSQTLALSNEREQWLHTLYHLGSELAGFADLDTLLAFVARRTREQLGAEVASVFLLHDDRLRRRKIDPAEDTWFADESYALGEGLTGQVAVASGGLPGTVVRENQVDSSPVVVSANLDQYGRLLKSGAVRHLLAVPLYSQQRCFGVLRLLNKLDAAGQLAAEGFTENDGHLLYTIGCEVGIAIENARLLDEVRLTAEQASQRARKLATLHTVSQTISATLDRPATLEATCQAAWQLFDVDHCGLVLFEPERGLGRVMAEYPSLGCVGFEVPLDVPAEQHLLANRPLIMADVENEPGLGPVLAIFRQLNICSTALVPLIGKDGVVLGSFSLDAVGRRRAFTAEDLDLCRTFAAHASLAIQHATLFEATVEQQQRLRNYVSGIGEKLVAHTDLDGLYSFVVNSGAPLLNAEDCSLYVVEPDTGRLHFTDASHLPVDRLASEGWHVKAEPRAGLTPYVAATGDSLRFVGTEYQRHPAWSGEFVDHLQYFASGECRSLLIVPMRSVNGEVVGVLKGENKLGKDGAQGFTDFDEELLSLLATQAAINIERLRQYARITREAAASERIRLQGELHDALNVFHSGVMLEAEVVQTCLSKGQIERAETKLRQLWRVSRFTYGELYNILQDLRDPILVKEGLAGALQHYAELVGPQLLEFHTDFYGRLPFNTEYALYRITQGAVNNAVKHAGLQSLPDGRVRIQLTVAGTYLRLRVEDNGQGFDEKQQRHPLGLERMQALARDLGTELRIESAKGRGTVVAVTIPLVELFHGK